MNSPAEVLAELMSVIEHRKSHPPARSYTTSLFAGGVDTIGAKVTEEAAEVVDAARNSDGPHLTREAADLIYHLFVMLAFREVTLQDVADELERRFGISGLDEKASRSRQAE